MVAPEDEFAAARDFMVTRDIAARGVRSPAVLAAMRAVPRHRFVPAELATSACADNPLPIGRGQTISQPYIVALMTEALALGPSDRVLELGTGSGYQAAVLARVAGIVCTVEYFADLAREAGARLRRLGYDNVSVRCGDAWGGWPERAPFDAAIVTFAAPEIPLLVAAQLRPGGRLCLPLGAADAAQELVLYEKRPDGRLVARPLGPVRFVPAQGRAAGR